MAFRERDGAGRQVRHTLGHIRDRDVLACRELRGRQGRWSRVPAIGYGDRVGRGGRPAQRKQESGTHTRMGLRRASAAQRRAPIQLMRLPRGPPRVPLLGCIAVVCVDRTLEREAGTLANAAISRAAVQEAIRSAAMGIWRGRSGSAR
jgi:hypothetical protein